MKLKHIDDCSKYFGYGMIDNSIVAESFSCNSDENVQISLISTYIELHCKKKYVYLFTSRTCQYPLTTMDKYLGLWNRIKKDYELQFFKKNEKKIEMERFCLYFGVAEIPKSQLGGALQLLLVDSINSYIILTNVELDLEQSIEKLLKKMQKNSGQLVNYTEIINAECYNNEIVTVIMGNDGCTVNYFYSRK